MTHTPSDPPWTPCRHHLFETLSAVRPEHRHHTTWRVPAVIWDRIKQAPDLRCDWQENGRGRTLLGQPVELVDRGLLVPEICLPTDCTPRKG